MQFNRQNSHKRFQKPIPVKEGETYEVNIENVGEKGDGIAKIEGYVIIVPDTKKGERVKVKVNAIRGKVSFAEVVERLNGSNQKETMSEESQDEMEDNQKMDEDSEEEGSMDESEDDEMSDSIEGDEDDSER